MIESTSSHIHGIRPGKLSAGERQETLIRRAWRPDERRIVVRGLLGRASIAIEPLICGIVFGVLTVGMFAAPHFSPRWVNRDIIILAPVFAVGVLACAIWGVGVLFAPVRALLHTLRPIYLVDGYIRFRGRDATSAADTNGYVAVLTEERRVACEWPTLGLVELDDAVRPALCEFTEYGGVHAIDGRPTGVLPSAMPPLGVGIAPREPRGGNEFAGR